MSTTAFTQMNVRIDAALKAAGDDALSSIGLTPTQAVRTLWELAAQRGEQLEKVHQFLRSTEEDGNQMNTMRMAWDQMLNDDKHKDIQAFAKRLIVYGFVTSGDISKPGTLFKFVPLSWRREISKNDGMQQSYTEYIDNFIEDGNARHQQAVDNK